MASRSEQDSPIITDGTTSFSGGVDSLKVTTVATQVNPGGLRRDQLAWLINGTVRDGGISPRWGWRQLCPISDGTERYQGGYLYFPLDSDPYLILQIGGKIIKVEPDTGIITDLSAMFGLVNPATTDRALFCQGEDFLIIQAGDYLTGPFNVHQNSYGDVLLYDSSTLPLFWDGTTLRRSRGLTDAGIAPGTGQKNEIPAAGPMDYYMGRIWYAQGHTFAGGDLVGSTSGTTAYDLRDAVLNVSQNPLSVGGYDFAVPDNEGNVRALAHGAAINVAEGQGQLFIFTHKAIYAITVPSTTTDWINASSTNQPTITVVQLVNGSVNDTSVVPVNGDLYYQSFEPGIRSLVAAIRYFQQPGNIQISANENRILQFNDRALLKYSSGIEFDNRLLETALPFELPVGTAHKALVPLDFIPVSSFNETYSPVWEGHWEGLDIMQAFSGDFSGQQRAFIVNCSRVDGGLYLWELSIGDRFENGDQRITMQIEFPAFNWNKINELKRLVGGELWIDRLYGTVEFSLDYRVDGETCWVPWFKWKECSARDTSEMIPPSNEAYPSNLGSGYRQTIDFPKPPHTCSQMKRPSDIGFQFQPRLTVHGYCRVRGIFLHALEYKRRLYDKIPC